MDRRKIDEKKCGKPLELHSAARQAFADRQVKLLDGPNWPLARWYNDEDFCRAYNTACMLADEVDRLKAELAAMRKAELAYLEHVAAALAETRVKYREAEEALRAVDAAGRGE